MYLNLIIFFFTATNIKGKLTNGRIYYIYIYIYIYIHMTLLRYQISMHQTCNNEHSNIWININSRIMLQRHELLNHGFNPSHLKIN